MLPPGKDILGPSPEPTKKELQATLTLFVNDSRAKIQSLEAELERLRAVQRLPESVPVGTDQLPRRSLDAVGAKEIFAPLGPPDPLEVGGRYFGRTISASDVLVCGECGGALHSGSSLRWVDTQNIGAVDVRLVCRRCDQNDTKGDTAELSWFADSEFSLIRLYDLVVCHDAPFQTRDVELAIATAWATSVVANRKQAIAARVGAIAELLVARRQDPNARQPRLRCGVCGEQIDDLARGMIFYRSDNHGNVDTFVTAHKTTCDPDTDKRGGRRSHKFSCTELGWYADYGCALRLLVDKMVSLKLDYTQLTSHIAVALAAATVASKKQRAAAVEFSKYW